MEQIFLYLAILAALAGFGMGLMNLAGPWLKRRNIGLPSLNLASDIRLRIASLRQRERGADDEEDDYDLGDEDDLDAARSFAENSFAPDASLLVRRNEIGGEDEEEELDEELSSVLDEVAEETIYAGEDEDEEEDEAADEEEPSVYTVAATIGNETLDDDAEEDAEEDDLLAASKEDEDSASDEESDFEDDEDEDEDEEEAEEPAVQVVAVGGDQGDMMSFFDEAADAGADAVAAWRGDLPEVSIEELLAEAQAIRAQIHGKKSDAA